MKGKRLKKRHVRRSEKRHIFSNQECITVRVKGERINTQKPHLRRFPARVLTSQPLAPKTRDFGRKTHAYMTS